jgi:hypothetical protein
MATPGESLSFHLTCCECSVFRKEVSSRASAAPASSAATSSGPVRDCYETRNRIKTKRGGESALWNKRMSLSARSCQQFCSCAAKVAPPSTLVIRLRL